MKYYNETLKIKTDKTYHFINLTDQIKRMVEKSGIKNGLINVQTLHTTTAIVVNEDEPLLLKDIESILRGLLISAQNIIMIILISARKICAMVNVPTVMLIARRSYYQLTRL